MNKVTLFYNTVKFLKAIQIYYRLFYFIRNKFRKFYGFRYPLSRKSNTRKLVLQTSLLVYHSKLHHNQFQFLNVQHDFKDNIDWNYIKNGKLWTYNLNYFDFLHQNSSCDGLMLIEDFIEKSKEITIGFESFPIALRGINWIKYFSYNNINNEKVNDSLYAQYYRLDDNLEYHLLGNHLLENGFSLLFGAYYFNDEYLYEKAKKILTEELDEQVLEDGAHFELSPMYHQIMLYRLLDCINLIQNNGWRGEALIGFLRDKASLMLGWLEKITYKNGDIPLLNDSTQKIALTSKELFEYAQSLSLKSFRRELNDSGYRKRTEKNYEAIVDVGKVGASYIPGHVHSDTFSFEVYVCNQPFIVDTGISTYERNDRRMYERSTKAHNTVELNGLNQTDVWGSFRVAKRAEIISLDETDKTIKATHDGYKSDNLYHTRVWTFTENEIVVEDRLNESSKAVSYLHFHPRVTREEIKESIYVKDYDIEWVEYQYAHGFNDLEKAWSLKIKFDLYLKMTIKINCDDN
ncbi:MAG TPA: alginate lyase family protein [Arcobacter sp.]|nr:alginate lyase family protein [Arcobacter sp.]